MNENKHLPSTLTNEEKVSEKEKQIEEMANFIARRSDSFRNPRVALITTARLLAEHLYNAGYRKQSEVIDEFVKRLLDAFPECNRDARCPAIYYDDYRYIIEELAEEMKGGEE